MDYAFLRNIDGAIIGVLRVADMACVPLDEANSDYAAYLEWVADGGQTGEWPPAE